MDNRTLILMAAEWMGVIATGMIASTSKRMAHKPIGFLYTRREVLYAAGLSAWLLLLAYIVHVSGFASSVISPYSPWFNHLIVAAVAALPFLLITLLRKQPVKAIGWSPVTQNNALRLGIVLMFLVLFLKGNFWGLIAAVRAPQLVQLLLILLSSLLEETVFRGFIQLRLAWAYKTPLGFLLTAVVFTSFYIPFLLLEPGGLPLNLLLTFIRSLVASWVMYKSGHVLTSALYRTVSTWLSLL